MNETTKGSTMFPMDVMTLPKELAGMTITAEGVNGKGNWSATYGIITIAKIIKQIGTLQIERRVQPSGAVLQIKIQQNQFKGFTQNVDAVVHCSNNVLASPLKWSWTEEISGSDVSVADTKLSKSGVVEGNQVAVTDKTGTRKHTLKKPCALNWALFDAVGRMPAKNGEPVEFDMIEHFDQVKGDYKIYFRSSKNIALSNGQAMANGFVQFGYGNLPWNYYAGQGGMLLMAVGGLEAYVLQKAGNI